MTFRIDSHWDANVAKTICLNGVTARAIGMKLGESAGNIGSCVGVGCLCIRGKSISGSSPKIHTAIIAHACNLGVCILHILLDCMIQVTKQDAKMRFPGDVYRAHPLAFFFTFMSFQDQMDFKTSPNAVAVSSN